MNRLWSRLKQSIVVVLSIMVVMLSGTGVSFASNVDQEFAPALPIDWPDIFNLCLDTQTAQTFTAGVNSTIKSVGIRVTTDSDVPMTATVQIRETKDGHPTDTVLGSGAITLPNRFNGWADIAISPVAVTKGEVYALVLPRHDCPEPAFIGWHFLRTDPVVGYPDGDRCLRDEMYSQTWYCGPFDFLFRTYLENGETRLYRLTLSTGSNDITLWGWDRTQSTSVPNSVDKITLTPELANGLSQLTVNGKAVDNKAHIEVPLAVGDNLITVGVTAENGAHLDYQITVRRAVSMNADLAGIVVQGYHMLEAFNASTTDYTLSVGSDVKEVTVGGVTANGAATVTINGQAMNYGAAVTTVALADGANTVKFDVTAQDGVTHKTYTLKIVRGDSQ